jgi:hypothetical protein
MVVAVCSSKTFKKLDSPGLKSQLSPVAKRRPFVRKRERREEEEEIKRMTCGSVYSG